MHLPFTTLDVFTTTRYTGNPLSIISLHPSTPSTPHPTQAQKQSIASEFNLSEIVFLHLPSTPASTTTELKIDIFTSYTEIPFAGHPTIGTAWYLLQHLEGTYPALKTLITKAGPIPISLKDGLISASIPHHFHLHQRTYHSPLNGKENAVASIVNGMSFIYVRLPSLSALGEARTNLNVVEFGDTYDVSALDEGWRNGLVGTMYFVEVEGRGEGGRKRYRTRMWASREDPGTGSASSGLGCYLAGLEGDNFEGGFAFEQGVEMGRKNEIVVDVKRVGGGMREVVLGGTAVKVMEGMLEV